MKLWNNSGNHETKKYLYPCKFSETGPKSLDNFLQGNLLQKRFLRREKYNRIRRKVIYQKLKMFLFSFRNFKINTSHYRNFFFVPYHLSKIYCSCMNVLWTVINNINLENVILYSSVSNYILLCVIYLKPFFFRSSVKWDVTKWIFLCR